MEITEAFGGDYPNQAVAASIDIANVVDYSEKYWSRSIFRYRAENARTPYSENID